MLDKNINFTGEVGKGSRVALGRQLTIEYYECGATALLDERVVETALLTAAHKSGATVINSSFHKFEPQGVSGVVVIMESHFTIHAWPEHNYAAVDIFSCGDNIDFETAIDSMKDSFQSGNVVISSDQNRGILSNPLEHPGIGQIINNSTGYTISWKKEHERTNPWGVSAGIDIYQADQEVIRNTACIEQFVSDLIYQIEKVRIGKDQVRFFGENGSPHGFSMTHPIQTTLVSAHFSLSKNTVYLNVFSCKFYEPRDIAEMAISFFNGKHYKLQIALRQ